MYWKGNFTRFGFISLKAGLLLVPLDASLEAQVKVYKKVQSNRRVTLPIVQRKRDFVEIDKPQTQTEIVNPFVLHFTQRFPGGSQNYSQWKLHWQFKGIIRSIRLQQLRRVIHFLHLCHNHNAQSSHQETVALRPLVRVLTDGPQRHPGGRQEYAL